MEETSTPGEPIPPEQYEQPEESGEISRPAHPIHVQLVYAPDLERNRPSQSMVPSPPAAAATVSPKALGRNRNRPSPSPYANLSQSPAERHRRKCQICRHAERETIEGDFLQWRSPWAITREYEIPEAALYRHAHAFGLFPLRRENLRLTLDRVLERGAQTLISGETIIRAVRAQACLTDDNRWVEPASRVVFSAEAPPNISPDPNFGSNRKSHD